jgi:hypothetical protein
LQIIWAGDVQAVVEKIVPLLLEDDARNVIYFDGWSGGLGASAVLRAIAEHPPQSLWEKFDKIIHIDWSRVKSPRTRQRAIVDELKLTQQVADLFYMQDEEDDFSGVDQGSRAEIRGITIVIARSLAQYRCLVVFHNGSDDSVDLSKYGIPQPEFYNTNKVLWTFRGRLRVGEEILRKVDTSHFQVRAGATKLINPLLAEEAREIALYTDRLGHGVTPEIATDCYLYLLSLNQRADVIDFNWPTHASNYWVCDGIVQGDEDNQAWELAHALQQHIRLEDYSSKTNNNRMPQFGSMLDISSKHWVSLTSSYFEEVPSRTTSLFFSPPLGYASLLSKEFHEADQLRVLKLCRCTFSFSSPPFHCCHNLRFLGLDRCMDEQRLAAEEEGETGALAVETFQRLWVLDVSQTDWELDFPLETEEAAVMVATNIREAHVNKGRIWRRSLAWRRLPNLRKLRVVDPTSSWETGRQDEFMDMVKLELLDLSGNSTMQVLPSLSGATNLKTLILDGCVGLEHVGPQGLPPSLESFCFSSGLGEDDEKKAKISHISLSGCASLANFRLHGSLPNLQELDLSHTAVKMVDLKDKAAVESLKKLLLVGCEQLRSISWPHEAWWYPVRLLCIDTRGGGEVSPGEGEDEHCFHAFVAVTDMRFLQSFVQFLSYFFEDRWDFVEALKAKVNICLSSPTKDDDARRSCRRNKKKKKMEEAAGAPVPRPLTYCDVSTRHQTSDQIDGSSSATAPFRPLDIHMEIGEGVSDVPNTASEKAGRAILDVMDKVESLHVHDSCSITSVTPEHIVVISPYPSWNKYTTSTAIARGVMNELRWCRVERCPRLQTVFNTRYGGVNFHRLETFWAAHLLMARSIWHSSPRKSALVNPADRSFEALRDIHLRFCPRLRHVLKLSWDDDLSQLETLHILYCGDLKQVFASDKESSVDQWQRRKGMLQFTKLKHLHLQELPNLQLICQAKMFAPNLETIYIRGCWGLRRLPATDICRCEDGRPVAVDCEKDWWDKLEWDGMEYDHHPSLFQPRHSKYYKKRHLRATVLR